MREVQSRKEPAYLFLGFKIKLFSGKYLSISPVTLGSGEPVNWLKGLVIPEEGFCGNQVLRRHRQVDP